jgi:hypothetical protein
MARQFDFGHVKNPAVIGDSMHFHTYRMDQRADGSFKPAMQARLRVCENISRSPALAAGEVVFGVITAARVTL